MLSPKTRSTAPLIRRLESHSPLSSGDRAAVAALGGWPVRKQPCFDLAREGETARVRRMIVSGWACRYKDLPNGRRQILGFVLPGEFCSPEAQTDQEMDYSIGALTEIGFIDIRPQSLNDVAQEHPAVKRALCRQELVEAATEREWLLSIGQRDAIEAIGHLLLELYRRCEVVGLAEAGSIVLPITQCHIAEATGLSPVHVNRTVQKLRRMGLIRYGERRLTILDLAQLSDIAMFDDRYLHIAIDTRKAG